MVSDYNPFRGDPSPDDGGPEIDLGVTAGDGQPTDQTDFEDQPSDYLDLDDDASQPLRPSQGRRPGRRGPAQRGAEGVQPDSRLHPQDPGAGARSASRPSTHSPSSEHWKPSQRTTLRLLGRAVRDSFEQSPPQQRERRPTTMATTRMNEDAYVDPVERRLAEQQKAMTDLAQWEQRRKRIEHLQRDDRWSPAEVPAEPDDDVNEVMSTLCKPHAGPESFDMI